MKYNVNNRSATALGSCCYIFQVAAPCSGAGAKFAVHNTTLTIHSYFRLEKGCRSNQFLFSMHHI